MARVGAVEYLGGLKLRLAFTDGLVRELDFDPVLRGGLFAELRDPEVFSEVAIDHAAGTIVFPTGVDFDPDVLHGDATPEDGSELRVLAERRLEQAG